MAKAPFPRKISLDHLAFYRAWMEGTIELGRAAAMYLETGTSRPAAKRVLKLVQSGMVDACRRMGRHGEANLLRLARDRLKAVPDTPPPANIPSFDAFQALNDPNGDFSYDELYATYKDTYREELDAAKSNFNRRAHRDSRLHKARIDLIRELSRFLGVSPAAFDDLRGWLDESVANRLATSGIQTVEALAKFINEHGYRWHRHIPRLGPQTAAWLIEWLKRNEPTIKIQILEFATTPRSLLDPSKIPRTAREIDSPMVLAEVSSRSMFGPVADGLYLAPEDLDGSRGRNRAPDDKNRTRAINDREAILEWLKIYAEPRHVHTRRNYMRESERLLLWSIFQKRVAFSSLTTEDVIEYRRFLADPQPYEIWVSDALYRRHKPEWKPFVWREPPRSLRHRVGADNQRIAGLSRESIRFSCTVLSRMCNWLMQQKYLEYNPFHGQPKSAARTKINVGRSLTRKQWEYVMDALDALPPDDPKSARLRFLFYLAYLTGMRLHEIANATMGDFHTQDLGESSPEGLEIKVMGKGEVLRSVPIPEPLQVELARYLRSRGLPEHPLLCPADAPLIARVVSRKSNSAQVSVSSLHKTFTSFFALVASRLPDPSPTSQDYQRLMQASAHWLRHTHGTHAVAFGASLETVKENLGHKSLTTTSIYINPESRVRHKEIGGFAASAMKRTEVEVKIPDIAT